MIHLPTKDRDNPPGRLFVNGALRQIQRAVQTGDGQEYNASYYPHPSVVELLRAYSIHKTLIEPGDKAKCNYCECQIEKAVTLQVEHYRPKAKVDAGENDHIELPGYYWLGLEWTNLLISCPKCNGKNAKGNKFPIRGIRAQAVTPVTLTAGVLILNRAGCMAHAQPLSLEMPLLLNPEIDYPEQFLTFDVFGNILGYGHDVQRGEITIDTCKLNRDLLVVERLEVWKEFLRRTSIDIGGHMMGEINDDGLQFNFQTTCREILSRKSPEVEFTLWGRYINDNIEAFIDEYIDVAYQDRFRQAYNLALAM